MGSETRYSILFLNRPSLVRTEGHWQKIKFSANGVPSSFFDDQLEKGMVMRLFFAETTSDGGVGIA